VAGKGKEKGSEKNQGRGQKRAIIRVPCEPTKSGAETQKKKGGETFRKQRKKKAKEKSEKHFKSLKGSQGDALAGARPRGVKIPTASWEPSGSNWLRSPPTHSPARFTHPGGKGVTPGHRTKRETKKRQVRVEPHVCDSGGERTPACSQKWTASSKPGRTRKKRDGAYKG